MRRAVTALMAALCAGAAPAAAQEVDDWEFAEDAGRRLTVAAVRYDAGPSIILRCQEGSLTAALVGMPAGAEKVELNATRADGRNDVQTWRPIGSDGTYNSTVPARDIRFLRGGGAYTVRTGAGVAPAFAATFDLPAGSANLDRVLTACGWTLGDDRDLTPRTSSALSFADPDAPPRRASRRSQPRSVTLRRRESAAPDTPPPVPFIPAEQQISCIVRDLRLTDCRPDHAAPPGGPPSADELRILEGRRVYAPDAAAEEGRVIYTHGPRLMTVVDYIGTVRTQ